MKVSKFLPVFYRNTCEMMDYAQSFAYYVDRKTQASRELRDILMNVYRYGGLISNLNGDIDEEVLPKEYWYTPILITPLTINGQTQEGGYDGMYITAKELALAMNGLIESDNCIIAEVKFSEADYTTTIQEAFEEMHPDWKLFRSGAIHELTLKFPYPVGSGANVYSYSSTLTINRETDLSVEIRRDPRSYPLITFDVLSTMENLNHDVNLNVGTTVVMDLLGKLSSLSRADVRSALETRLGSNTNQVMNELSGMIDLATNPGLDSDSKIKYCIEYLNNDVETNVDTKIKTYDDDQIGAVFSDLAYTGTPASAMWNGASASNACKKALMITGEVLKKVCQVVIALVKTAFNWVKKLWNKWVKPAYVSKDFVKSEGGTTETYCDVPFIQMGTTDEGIPFSNIALMQAARNMLGQQRHYELAYELNYSINVTDNVSVPYVQFDNVDDSKEGNYFYHIIEMANPSYKNYANKTQMGVQFRYCDHQGHLYDAKDVDLNKVNMNRFGFGYVRTINEAPVRLMGPLGSLKQADSVQVSGIGFSNRHGYVSTGNTIEIIKSKSTAQTILQLNGVNIVTFNFSDDIQSISAISDRYFNVANKGSYTTSNGDEIYTVTIAYLGNANSVVTNSIVINFGRFSVVFSISDYDRVTYLNGEYDWSIIGSEVDSTVEYVDDSSIVISGVDEVEFVPYAIIRFAERTIFPLEHNDLDEFSLKLVETANVLHFRVDADNVLYYSSLDKYNYQKLNDLKMLTADYPKIYEYYVYIPCVITSRFSRCSDGYLTIQAYYDGATESLVMSEDNISKSGNSYYDDGSDRTYWDGDVIHHLSMPINQIPEEKLNELVGDIHNPIDEGTALVQRFKFGALQMMGTPSEGMRMTAYLSPVSFKAILTNSGKFKIGKMGDSYVLYQDDDSYEILPREDIHIYLEQLLSNLSLVDESYDAEEGDLRAYRDMCGSKKLFDFYFWMLNHVDSDLSEYFDYCATSSTSNWMCDSITWKNDGDEVNNIEFVNLIYDSRLRDTNSSYDIIYSTMFNILLQVISNKPAFMRIYFILFGEHAQFVPYLIGDRLQNPKWHVQTDDDIQQYVDTVCAICIIAVAVIVAVAIGLTVFFKIKGAIRKQIANKRQEVATAEWNGTELRQKRDKTQGEIDAINDQLNKTDLDDVTRRSLTDQKAALETRLKEVKSEIKINNAKVVRNEKVAKRWTKLGEKFGLTPSAADDVRSTGDNGGVTDDDDSINTLLETDLQNHTKTQTKLDLRSDAILSELKTGLIVSSVGASATAVLAIKETVDTIKTSVETKNNKTKFNFGSDR